MLGERGRWIGVAVAVLVLGGIGAALMTAKDSSTATQAASPARATTTTAAAASATTTTSDTPVLRALHPAAGKFKPDGTTVDELQVGHGLPLLRAGDRQHRLQGRRPEGVRGAERPPAG